MTTKVAFFLRTLCCALFCLTFHSYASSEEQQFQEILSQLIDQSGETPYQIMPAEFQNSIRNQAGRPKLFRFVDWIPQEDLEKLPSNAIRQLYSECKHLLLFWPLPKRLKFDTQRLEFGVESELSGADLQRWREELGAGYLLNAIASARTPDPGKYFEGTFLEEKKKDTPFSPLVDKLTVGKYRYIYWPTLLASLGTSMAYAPTTHSPWYLIPLGIGIVHIEPFVGLLAKFIGDSIRASGQKRLKLGMNYVDKNEIRVTRETRQEYMLALSGKARTNNLKSLLQDLIQILDDKPAQQNEFVAPSVEQIIPFKKTTAQPLYTLENEGRGTLGLTPELYQKVKESDSSDELILYTFQTGYQNHAWIRFPDLDEENLFLFDLKAVETPFPLKLTAVEVWKVNLKTGELSLQQSYPRATDSNTSHQKFFVTLSEIQEKRNTEPNTTPCERPLKAFKRPSQR